MSDYSDRDNQEWRVHWNPNDKRYEAVCDTYLRLEDDYPNIKTHRLNSKRQARNIAVLLNEFGGAIQRILIEILEDADIWYEKGES